MAPDREKRARAAVVVDVNDNQRGRTGPNRQHRTIEERLETDALAFQAECAALDHQGALRRTLDRLGLDRPAEQDDC